MMTPGEFSRSLLEIVDLTKSLDDSDMIDAGGMPTFSKSEGVTALTFSNDGKMLAVGWPGRVEVLLLPESSQELVAQEEIEPPVRLEGFQGDPIAIAFSPDDATVAVGLATGDVLLFELDGAARMALLPVDPVSAVCETVWRNLSWEEWSAEFGPGTAYQPTCENLPPGEGVSPDLGQTATPALAGGETPS
jgi:hypothetical protein